MSITEQECVEALRRAADRLGRSPTKAEHEDLGFRPASGSIVRVLGGWNDAKEAAGLETYHSRGSRLGPKPDDVDLPEGTAWGDLSQDQRWHYRHPEENNRRSLQRRAELRAWLYRYRRDSDGCVRCDEGDPVCLDFHHPPGVEKTMTVGRMVPAGKSRADIEAEVERCVLLCANCHWREHTSLPAVVDRTGRTPGDRVRGPPSSPDEVNLDGGLDDSKRLRAWTSIYKTTKGFRRCGEADPACLQFHHPDGVEKTEAVGQMISNEYPGDAVVAEVARCEVLCANCHRREHYDRPSNVDEMI